ncbi:HD domain-containing protein [Clostridium bowmanii]|uniref:HD domain-containing protein n=1 Tax=Clostridium bowmanii TaxID=132925 RepID=UPI001C0E8B38|nr:HD domain-containing protein [Clostridium bowmanii]MBU3189795.1 HD domain-containing protein [Clostridium bowmanii]MCA1074278.1 HD domain-containing protein [Clostridium bowmanii]
MFQPKYYSKGVEIIDNNLMNYKINIIIENHIFQNNLSNIENLEKLREFCKHDMQHFLDVARIMYIMSLENNLDIPKYVIYATALLHDIGRGEEYEKGTPHNTSSVVIAKNILQQCSYNTEETNKILEAIGDHRSDTKKSNSLSHILYVCDKLSRNCSNCKATDNCKWPVQKKNFKITY